MPKQLLRYRDLEHSGVVANRMQLSRLVEKQGFPKGFMLSANTRVWDAAEIEEWVARRRSGAREQ